MPSWEEDRILVLGHRGYMAKFPENTLLAYKKAIEAGADGVEVDVWLTKDGNVIALHDETLERTAKIRANIKDMTLKELKKADVGMGEKIPTLREILEILPKDSLINIEIKDVDAVEATYDIIKEYNAVNRTLISSFNIEALHKARELDNKIKLGVLIGNEEIVGMLPKLKEELKLYSANAPMEGIPIIGFERFYQAVAWAKKLGFKMILWTEIDELYYQNDHLKRLKGLFDVVITDDIEKMFNLLREMGLR